METTETKKKGRIRHCYPRKEIYHRWVHSPEYVYTPKGGYRCAGAGNYLRICDLYYGKTNEEIIANWSFNRDGIIAIIDRDKKKILINTIYNQHIWELKNAIPNNYKIFETDEIINNPNILQNNKELYKTHAKYLVKNIVNYYREEYLCLAGKIKHIYDNEYVNKEIEKLKNNIIKCHFNKYNFYNKCLGEHIIKQHNGYNSKTVTINLPTIKQIVTDNIFNNEEKIIIEQYKFYTKYCYGNGVSLKWLKEHWNKIPTKKEAIKYFENKTEFRNQNQWIDEDNKLSWQELIKKSNEILNKYINNQRDIYIKQSNENLHKAIEKLNSFNNCSVNAWRKGKVNNQRTITYERFIPSYRKGQIGKWENAILRSNINNFLNTQLKLNSNKDKIITSKNAIVPLSDAIIKFKLINKCITEIVNYLDNSKLISTNKIFNNVNVGIYNLRFIKYIDKKTDTGKLLDKKEWLIQIGCHSLWMDDILDFIHYYHLEKEFGIDDNKKDVKIKIQIKK